MQIEELFTTTQKCTSCGWVSSELVKVGDWPYCAQCLAKENIRDGEVIKNLNAALNRLDNIIQKHVMDNYKMEQALKSAGIAISTLGIS